MTSIIQEKFNRANIPVIVSGGAGNLEDLENLFSKTRHSAGKFFLYLWSTQRVSSAILQVQKI